jgi:hypothetical protein
MDYKTKEDLFNELSKLSTKYNVTFVTAKQPNRTINNVENVNTNENNIYIVDYLNIIK